VTLARYNISRRLYQIALGPFQLRIERQFPEIGLPNSILSRPFKPHGFRTSHEPRCTISATRGRR